MGAAIRSHGTSWDSFTQTFELSCNTHRSDVGFDVRAQLRTLRTAGFTAHALASALLDAESDLEQVARRSYTHPNGFDKIVLFQPRDDYPSLRLHIWWPDHERTQPEQIHNHAWNFASHLEAGTLRFIMYAAADVGPLFTEVRATSPSTPSESYQHEIVGEARLAVGFDGDMVAGTEYYLPHTTPHRVLVGNAFSATLMLQAPAAQNHSTVFLVDGDSRDETIDVVRFNDETLTATLSRAGEILGR